MTFYPFYLYYLVDSHFQCRINSHNKADAILHTNMHSGCVLWVHMVMVMYSEWFCNCHLLLPPNKLGGAWVRNTSLLFKPQVFGEFFLLLHCTWNYPNGYNYPANEILKCVSGEDMGNSRETAALKVIFLFILWDHLKTLCLHAVVSVANIELDMVTDYPPLALRYSKK